MRMCQTRLAGAVRKGKEGLGTLKDRENRAGADPDFVLSEANIL